MNKYPLISIIMPCFNSEVTIRESIESIQNQTYSFWELIIADDASTDHSVKIIQEYANNDPRIRLIYNTCNQGVSSMRNQAIDQSVGDYLCFLDADDIWPNFKLSMQIEYMQKTQSMISIGYFMDVTSAHMFEGYIRKCPRNLTYQYLLKNNCVLFQTMMVNAIIKHLLHFEPYRHEDYILALKLLQNNVRFDVIDEVLAYRRRNHQSLTSNKIRSACWRWQVYRDILKMKLLPSCWYFCIYGLYMIYFKADHIYQKKGRIG